MQMEKVKIRYICSILIYLYLLSTVKAVPAPHDLQLNINCDFDNGLCPGYKHDQNEKTDFKWQINNGTTSSPGTGPTGDSTPGKNGKGHYIYLESSKRLNGEIARFKTVLLHSTQVLGEDVCLMFHYHMRGHTMGELSVFIQEESTGKETLKFQLSGKQDITGWNLARLPFHAPYTNFQIIFQGKTSFSSYGDIAIDDIKLTKSRTCYFWPFHGQPDAVPAMPPLVVPKNGPENPSTCGRRKQPGIPVLPSNMFPPVARILGGTVAKHGNWPWMTMIQKRGAANHFTAACGGTLLGTNWVITAAHCVADIPSRNLIRVRLGAQYRNKPTRFTQDIEVENVYVHPDYNMGTRYNNDIALVKLRKPAMINKYAESICLPDEKHHFEGGELCFVTGWGKLWNDSPGMDAPYSAKLLEGKVLLQSQSNCTNVYGSLITDSMLCAGRDYGYPDTCRGDSGGPLMCQRNGKWILVGITSWGHSDGCGLFKKYGVYTRVNAVQVWIKLVTKHPDQYTALYY